MCSINKSIWSFYFSYVFSRYITHHWGVRIQWLKIKIHFSLICATSHIFPSLSFLSLVIVLLILLSFVLSVSFFFSVCTSSLFPLNRGDPASETQAWDLPLPQLPHPVHGHPVPPRCWLFGLWKQLCLQSCHITPFILSPLRPQLAKKECVLYWGPLTGKIWYSCTVLCLWGEPKCFSQKL